MSKRNMTTLTAIKLPSITYTSRAIAGLTPREEIVLRLYLDKLAEIGSTISSPITELTIDIFIDPEENDRQIVVTSRFDVEANTALLYWDKIGNAFDGWAAGPDAATAQNVLQLITTDVRWRS
jgi:hypothetical protein